MTGNCIECLIGHILCLHYILFLFFILFLYYFSKANIILEIFWLFCSAGVRTQGLANARQAVLTTSYIPTPVGFLFKKFIY
jgi:hypothetical protein